jgi:hypothetical protein
MRAIKRGMHFTLEALVCNTNIADIRANLRQFRKAETNDIYLSCNPATETF